MLSDLADLIEEGHLDQRASVRSKTSANLAGRRRSSQLGRDDLSTGSEAPTNRRSVVRQAPEPAGRKALRNIRKASRSYEHVAASSRGAIHVGKASHHQKRASRDTIRYQKEKLANAAKGREFETPSVANLSKDEEAKYFGDDARARFAAAWISTAGSGRPDKTLTFSRSVTSKLIRLIFGCIDRSQRVLEARPKRLNRSMTRTLKSG